MINGEDFVEYIIYRKGKVKNTQLHKIAYLTELEYMKRHGERLSDLVFCKYHHGPYSFDIPVIQDEDENIIVEDVIEIYPSKISQLKDELKPNIPEKLRKELDEIISNFTEKNGSELERLAKNTEPYIDADELREQLDLDGYAEYYKALLSEDFWENVNKIDEENEKNKVYGKIIIEKKPDQKIILS